EVHRGGGTVVDTEERPHAALLEPDVRVQQLAEAAERERDVMQARRLGRLDHELGRRGVARGERAEVRERDAVMLVVVGHEAEALVLVDDAGAERRAVPVAHRGNAIRLKDHVSQLGRRHEMPPLRRRVGCVGRWSSYLAAAGRSTAARVSPRAPGGTKIPGPLAQAAWCFAQSTTWAWVANQTPDFERAWRISSSMIQMRDR